MAAARMRHLGFQPRQDQRYDVDMDIRHRASPNFGPRTGQDAPHLIVIHHTAMESAEAAIERLCDPGPEVSAHYVIGEEGCVWQLVDEADRAWHAGRSCWRGLSDVNSASVGIELANPAGLAGFPPFGAAQMAALETLLRLVMARWDIGASAVLGHSDVAPGRKADPGPKFDWARLARGGLAAARPDGRSGGDFCGNLARYGYDVSNEGAALAAFRLRWRPEAIGAPLDETDRQIAAGLAAL